MIRFVEGLPHSKAAGEVVEEEAMDVVVVRVPGLVPQSVAVDLHRDVVRLVIPVVGLGEADGPARGATLSAPVVPVRAQDPILGLAVVPVLIPPTQDIHEVEAGVVPDLGPSVEAEVEGAIVVMISGIVALGQDLGTSHSLQNFSCFSLLSGKCLTDVCVNL